MATSSVKSTYRNGKLWINIQNSCEINEGNGIPPGSTKSVRQHTMLLWGPYLAAFCNISILPSQHTVAQRISIQDITSAMSHQCHIKRAHIGSSILNDVDIAPTREEGTASAYLRGLIRYIFGKYSHNYYVSSKERQMGKAPQSSMPPWEEHSAPGLSIYAPKV